MTDTVRSASQPLLVELGGDFDLVNATALGDALCEAIDRTRVRIVVDLTEVPFIDSCAVGMMLRVHRHAVSNRSSVTWRGLQPAPTRVLKTVTTSPRPSSAAPRDTCSMASE